MARATLASESTVRNFTWGNGTLAAAQANIFTVEADAGGGTRTMQITGSPSVFKTEYIQTVPDGFTGAGTFKICGGGLSLGELSGGNGTFWQTDGVVTNYGVCFVGNGTFSGVPSLDVKGYSIRLSSDRKRVVVVRNGMTIIVR